MSIKPIKDVVISFLKKNKLEEINSLVYIEKKWNSVVGKIIVKKTQVLNYKGGVLFVKVINPVWRNELSLQKNELLKKLNKTNNKIKITEIKFK